MYQERLKSRTLLLPFINQYPLQEGLIVQVEVASYHFIPHQFRIQLAGRLLLDYS